MKQAQEPTKPSMRSSTMQAVHGAAQLIAHEFKQEIQKIKANRYCDLPASRRHAAYQVQAGQSTGWPPFTPALLYYLLHATHSDLPFLTCHVPLRTTPVCNLLLLP